jgi:hypothetical protein
MVSYAAAAAVSEKYISANVVMTGTKLCSSLADASMDNWEHGLGLGDEIGGS